MITNTYVWHSEQAARAFFTPELKAKVIEFYGAEPNVQFAEVSALIDNRDRRGVGAAPRRSRSADEWTQEAHRPHRRRENSSHVSSEPLYVSSTALRRAAYQSSHRSCDSAAVKSRSSWTRAWMR